MASGSQTPIQSYYALLVSRRKRIGVLGIALDYVFFVGSVAAALAVFAFFLGHYAGDYSYPVLKYILIIASLFGFVWGLTRLYAFISGGGVDREVFRLLAERGADLDEDVLSALELSGQSQEGRLGPVSEGFAKAHSQRISGLVSSVISRDTLPVWASYSSLSPGFRKSLASLSAAVLFMLLVPAFSEFVLSPALFSTGDVYSLELANINLTYHYPAYSGLQTIVVEDTTGDIKALAGTVVEFEAVALGGIDSGEIVINDSLSIALDADGDLIRGELGVVKEGGYHIRDSVSGRRSRDYKITVQVDEPPAVLIDELGFELSEDGVLVLEAEDVILLSFSATDDYGLSGVSMVQISDDGEAERPIAALPGSPQNYSGDYALAASAIEGQQGEVVELFIAALDNDTISGPKRGLSAPIKVMLSDPLRRHGEMVSSLDTLFERVLDVLADDIESRPESRPESGALDSGVGADDAKTVLNSQRQIEEKMSSMVDILENLIIEMEADELSDYLYFVALSNMLDRVDTLLFERTVMLKDFGALYPKMLDGRIIQEIREFEEDVIFLDSLLQGERIKESLYYGKSINELYDEINLLLNELKAGEESSELQAAIAEKLRELERKMSRLAESLASIGEFAPDGFLNPDALKSLDLGSKLKELKELAENGNVEEAFKLLAELETMLGQMMASLENGMNGLGSDFLSEQMTRLSEMIDEIKRLENAERGLVGATEGLKSELLKTLEETESKQQAIKDEQNSLLRHQAEIKLGTGDLAAEFEELRKKSLIMPGDALRKLYDAGSFMESASSDLKNMVISRAISHETEAAEALKEAGESAQRRLEQMIMSSRGKGPSAPFMLSRGESSDNFGDIDTTRVDIPPEQESIFGTRLRERVQKFMKKGSPKGFEELNSKYYKRIIR